MQFSHVTQEEVLNIRKGLTKGSVPKRKKTFLMVGISFCYSEIKSIEGNNKIKKKIQIALLYGQNLNL